MRTTLTIEDGLLVEAKRRARECKSTLGEVVNEALKAGLLGAGSALARRKEAPLKTFRGGGVQPGIDLNHSAGLIEAMEER